MDVRTDALKRRSESSERGAGNEQAGLSAGSGVADRGLCDVRLGEQHRSCRRADATAAGCPATHGRCRAGWPGLFDGRSAISARTDRTLSGPADRAHPACEHIPAADRAGRSLAVRKCRRGEGQRLLRRRRPVMGQFGHRTGAVSRSDRDAGGPSRLDAVARRGLRAAAPGGSKRDSVAACASAEGRQSPVDAAAGGDDASGGRRAGHLHRAGRAGPHLCAGLRSGRDLHHRGRHRPDLRLRLLCRLLLEQSLGLEQPQLEYDLDQPAGLAARPSGRSAAGRVAARSPGRTSRSPRCTTAWWTAGPSRCATSWWTPGPSRTAARSSGRSSRRQT